VREASLLHQPTRRRRSGATGAAADQWTELSQLGGGGEECSGWSGERVGRGLYSRVANPHGDLGGPGPRLGIVCSPHNSVRISRARGAVEASTSMDGDGPYPHYSSAVAVHRLAGFHVYTRFAHFLSLLFFWQTSLLAITIPFLSFLNVVIIIPRDNNHNDNHCNTSEKKKQI
jgi:hypothetical protein